MSNSPLQGIRVLDLSRVLAGPVCGQVLADLGADVVKVERPGLGDETRQWGPPFLPAAGNADAERVGPSAYYLAANRGKRSLALNLTHPRGQAVLADLVRRADILIENFITDSLEKLGLSPERLRELNPKLVTCSISGYGRTGPAANLPGYDLVIQAQSGLMSITGDPNGPPCKVGVALTDVLTGLYAAICALAGLRQREQAGSGLSYDLALADCTLASLVNVAQSCLISGQSPQRYGNAHPQIVPYEVFATADGHLALAVGNDPQWRRFCAAARMAAWAEDERFATNPQRVLHRHELIPRLQQVFARQTTADWEKLLLQAEVPHGAVLALDQSLSTPQMAARGMTQTVTDSAGRTYQLLASPIHVNGDSPGSLTAPPDLGEHSDAVLRDWLDYDPAKIAALRQAHVVT